MKKEREYDGRRMRRKQDERKEKRRETTELKL